MRPAVDKKDGKYSPLRFKLQASRRRKNQLLIAFVLGLTLVSVISTAVFLYYNRRRIGMQRQPVKLQNRGRKDLPTTKGPTVPPAKSPNGDTSNITDSIQKLNENNMVLSDEQNYAPSVSESHDRDKIEASSAALDSRIIVDDEKGKVSATPISLKEPGVEKDDDVSKTDEEVDHFKAASSSVQNVSDVPKSDESYSSPNITKRDDE